jgi:hypothetical protein
MRLSDALGAVAIKRLVRVDLPGRGSNQHEINGARALQAFFGGESRETVTWIHLTDASEPVHGEGRVSFYDARRAHPTRTEWRLYYDGDFLGRADEGDLLVLLRVEGALHALVVQGGSSWERLLEELVTVGGAQARFTLADAAVLEARELDYRRGLLLEALGLPVERPVEPDDEALVLREFGRTFPTTAILSAFARRLADASGDADVVLMAWLDREERLFRALERLVIADRVAEGFNDTDAFVAFAQTVLQRRKSRMGYVLENHVEALLLARGIPHARGATTEGRSKPDFLVPGVMEYRSGRPCAMLATKSTCKDRWRQILAEAERIDAKHLLTLEAAISEAQTDEMWRSGVRLVLPAALHPTFTSSQRSKLLTVETLFEELEVVAWA